MHVDVTVFIWVLTQIPAPIGIHVLSKVRSCNMPQNQWHVCCAHGSARKHMALLPWGITAWTISLYPKSLTEGYCAGLGFWYVLHHTYISKVIYHDHCRDQKCQFLWQMTSAHRSLKWPIFLEKHDYILKMQMGFKCMSARLSLCEFQCRHPLP